MSDPALRRAAATWLALLSLAACADWPGSIRLPGGPTRGSMTYDEAMGARSGLTTVDRVPSEDAARR